MKEIMPVIKALDDLENVHAALDKIGERIDDARRHELVQLRRASATATVELVRLADPLFAGNSTEHAEFRKLYSAMRSAIASHQADWPAIRLNDANEGYVQSGQHVRAANVAFMTWLRAHLKSLNG